MSNVNVLRSQVKSLLTHLQKKNWKWYIIFVMLQKKMTGGMT